MYDVFMWILSIKYFRRMLNLQQSNSPHMSHLMTKPTKWHVCPARTPISLSISPVWSESSLSAWRKLGFLATHWAHNEDSDHLIWIFAGLTVILFVLSWNGSNICKNIIPLNDRELEVPFSCNSFCSQKSKLKIASETVKEGIWC